MATVRIPILNFGSVPDASGDVFFQILSGVTSAPTSSTIDPIVLSFIESGNKDGVRGSFEVPNNYVDTAQFVIIWSSNVTTNSVQWDLSYLVRAGDDSESFDVAAESTTDTVSDVAPSAAWERLEATIVVTDVDFTKNDTVQFELFRDGATESIVGDVHVFALMFEYNDA